MLMHTPFSALEYIWATHGRPTLTQHTMIPLIEHANTTCTAFLVTRQSGSTDAIIASAIHDAISNDSKTIAISTNDWLGYCFRIVSIMQDMFGTLASAMITEQNRSCIKFVNNSRIIIKSRSLNHSTYRGYTLHRIYLDCNIYDTDWNYFMLAVMPTLASTRGKLVAVFTATKKDSNTHKFWNSFPDDQRHVIVEPMDPKTSAYKLAALGQTFFETEYMCKFI